LKSLATMSPDQIRQVLLRGTTDRQTLEFIMSLYDCADSEEVPEMLVCLARAAEITRDKPELDIEALTLRELGALLGSGVVMDIPGLTDTCSNVWDTPIRELPFGPHEAQYHAHKYSEQLDADTAAVRAKTDAELAALYRFPDP